MTTLTTIRAQLINEDSRERIAKSLADVERDNELPEELSRAVRRLFSLILGGEDVTMVASSEHLTSNQAATLLGVSRPLLNKLLDEGRIPFHKNGRDRRIAMSDLARYIEEREHAKREYASAAAEYESNRTERLAAIAERVAKSSDGEAQEG